MDVKRVRSAIGRRWLAVAAAGFLVPMAPLATAQGSDDLYDVTMKMEMVGMPMSMPPVSQRVCVRKGGSDGDFVPRQENCSVSDVRRSGSQLSFRMACTGSNAMTGTGEFTFAADAYNGIIRLKGKMEGEAMEMTQTVAGRRVGACTAK